MTTEVLAVAWSLARMLREVAGEGWTTATMQIQQSPGGMSADARTDTDSWVMLNLGRMWPLTEQLDELLRAPSDVKPLVIELVLRNSGEFELAYTLDLDSLSPTRLTFDRNYRLPGHPLPDMPIPAAARNTGDPTDPEVLKKVSALVQEFGELYTAVKGHSPFPGSGHTEEELSAAESKLGARLPEDLRALYRTIRGDTAETGLLGRYSPYPLDTVVELYLEGSPGSPGWDDDLFEGGVVFDTTPPGLVRRVSRNDWWITFATDYAGNCLATDLDPADHGQPGQVIEYGRDIHGPVRYVRASVIAMLTEVVEALRAGNYSAGASNSPHLRASVDFEDDNARRSYEQIFYNFGEQDLATAVLGLDGPLIQQVYINDSADLDLAALVPLHNLREISVNRATSVLPRLAGQVSIESLSIEAERADLDLLVGQPTLWDLKLKGLVGPVEIGPLSTLPALAKLDISGVDVTDVEQVISFPGLRVLILNRDQWQRLRHAGRRPTGLAAAELAGYSSLAEAVDWITSLSEESGVAQPRLHRLAGSIT